MPTPFYFLTDSYKSFRNVMINMGQNSPDLWERLITASLNRINVNYPTTPEQRYSPDIERYIEWCNQHAADRLKDEDQQNLFLEYLYGRRAGEAIEFLLSRADEQTQREFAAGYLDGEYLSQQARVDIVIKKSESAWWPHRSNRGRYLICTRKGNEQPTSLLFTNQASAVYYLLILIDYRRRNKFLPWQYAKIPPPKLYNNEAAFCEIYNMVYGMKRADAYDKFRKLLYREDRSGHMRSGRLADTILDIRNHLAEAFEHYGESFAPYAMSSRSHLTVPPNHIIFEGDATKLLDIPVI